MTITTNPALSVTAFNSLKESDTVRDSEELFEMAFIICDDHNLDVEADGIDNAAAKQLMLTDAKPDATATEKEIIEFGKKHRDCNIRILAG